MIHTNINYCLFDITDQQLNPQDIKTTFSQRGFQVQFNSFGPQIFNRKILLLGAIKSPNSPKITKSELELFEKCIHAFPKSIPDTKDDRFFWIYNIDESILSKFLIPIFNLIGISPNSSVVFQSDKDPLMLFLNLPNDETRFRMLSIIPYFINYFRSEIGDKVGYATKSEDVPCVIIKNSTPASFHLLKIIIENTLHIPIINFWTKSDSIYILLKDNNQVWTIINQLNFITLDDGKEIQFTHFLHLKKIEEIKKWNMKLTGVSENETSRSLFRQYSRMNGKEQRKIISLQLDPPNAYIQFLYPSAAKAAASFNGDVQSSSNSDIRMLVYYFGGTTDELKNLFKGVLSVKSLNAISIRPVYSVQFLNQAHLEKALKKSGNIAPSLDDDASHRHEYKLQMGDGIGLFSNNLRILCFDPKDFPKFSNINTCLNSLSKEGQVYGIKVCKLPTSVDFPDIIQAIKEIIGPDVYLETCIVVNHQAFVGFHKKEDYDTIMEYPFITIQGDQYLVKSLMDKS